MAGLVEVEPKQFPDSQSPAASLRSESEQSHLMELDRMVHDDIAENMALEDSIRKFREEKAALRAILEHLKHCTEKAKTPRSL